MDSVVPRRLAKLQYAAARLPFTVLDEWVVARYWSQDAPVRVGFERWLGSLDVTAGRFLADEEISRRGQALMRLIRDPAQDRGPVMDAPPVQTSHPGHVQADPSAGQPGTPAPPAAGAGTVEVTFVLPADVHATTVALCGEFNDWSAEDTQLERGSDGSWRATVALEPGRSYRYRYLLDGQRWENDRNADHYVPNALGSTDSVVVVG
jgi:hypothetical protein